MLDTLAFGRRTIALGQVVEQSVGAGFAFRGIAIGLILCAILGGWRAFLKNGRVRLGDSLVLLLPWVSLNGAYWVGGGRYLEIVMAPVAILTLLALRPCSSAVYQILRLLVVFTAVGSLVLGLAWPDLFLSDPGEVLFNEKAFIGTQVLNGLYSHSNQLGINLAIGIPLLMTTGVGRFRWVSVAATLLALAWSSSRTAILAACLVLVLILTLRFCKALGVRRMLWSTATCVAGAVVVAMPLVAQNPEAFSGRVAIWKTSLEVVGDGNLLAGAGALVFREASDVTLALGAAPNTGHNVFITVLTIGGVVALIFSCALWVALFARARRAFTLDEYPSQFVFLITFLSIVEDPLRAFVIGPAFFIVVPMVVSVVARSRD